MIPELFPENDEGQDHYAKYNTAKEIILSLAGSSAVADSLSLDNFIKTEGLSSLIYFFELDLNDVGYALLKKGKTDAAIHVFKLNVNYFPKSWNCYDSLADGYMKAENYSLALLNYKKSVEMNSENKHGHKQIHKIEKRGKR